MDDRKDTARGNAARELLKRTATSELFLTCAVLLSLSAVLAGAYFVLSGVPMYAQNTYVFNKAAFPHRLWYDLGVERIPVSNLVAAAAFWATYASAKRSGGNSFGTAGMTALKIWAVVQIVLESALILVLLFFGAVEVFYPAERLEWSTGLVLAIIILFLILLVLLLIYAVKLFALMKNWTRAVWDGVPVKKIPVYLIVMQGVFAAYSLTVGLGHIAAGDTSGAVLSLVDAAAKVVLIVCMGRFNGGVKREFSF